MLPDTRDTIAAVATAPGVGAIGIVRISGPEAVDVFDRVFRASGDTTTTLEPRHITHGHVLDHDGARVDEVLGWFAHGPGTYTGEDLAELQGHGGPYLLSQVLQACIDAGCRPAQPGEFTRRAFLSGRIDLTRAEATASLIGATTSGASRVAQNQLDGALSGRVGDLRQEAIEILAHVEASVDYPDEPITPSGGEDLALRLDALVSQCSALADTFETGRLLTEGARVALVGRPNVGKSSLLNALTDRSRAIVTPEAGTTRDVVEATVEWGGFPVTLLDTAGVRELGEHDSAAEAEGIRRSREASSTADLILLVTDGSEPLHDWDRDLEEALEPASQRVLHVVNKNDLPQIESRKGLHVSAETGDGIDELRRCIQGRLTSETMGEVEGVVLTRARHRDVIMRSAEAFAAAAAGIRSAASPELPASDLRAALAALGEITGETTPEDVLDIIFSRFCIGK